LLAFHLISTGGIQKGFRQTGETRRSRSAFSEQVFSEKIKGNNFIPALTQPRTGDIKRLLRTQVPKAAKGVAIDPESAFAESANVEKDVSGRTGLEVSPEKCRPRFRVRIRPVFDVVDTAEWQATPRFLTMWQSKV
jgi:hypothetical protein